jgi:hypothetical protein
MLQWQRVCVELGWLGLGDKGARLALRRRERAMREEAHNIAGRSDVCEDGGIRVELVYEPRDGAAHPTHGAFRHGLERNHLRDVYPGSLQ